MEADSEEIVYGLNDRPPLGQALLAALQHLLAIFVGIVTPALVVAGPLELDHETTNYLVSMALFVAGVSTAIQIRGVGPIGSRLLSVQGTSFAFVDPMISAGTSAGLGTAGLSMIYGLTLVGSTIEMVLSRFVEVLRRVLAPIVTGTVVTLIGLSLVGFAFTEMAGGEGAEDFGSLENLGLAGLTIAVIVAMNRASNTLLRIGAIFIGVAVGYAVAAALGRISFESLSGLPAVSVPIPFRYGLDFDLWLFIPVALVYVVTTIESAGDMTATSVVSGEPTEGDVYIRRIKGGILGDGVNSAIGAVCNAFPNTTFSQNNGVIQITGVASRFVGYFVALFLVVIGLVPAASAVITSVPAPVLGGAALVMFGTVAAAGIKVIATAGELGRRDLLIVAVSLGLGLGVELAPEALQELPETVQNTLGSPITVGSLTAVLLNLALPKGD